MAQSVGRLNGAALHANVLALGTTLTTVVEREDTYKRCSHVSTMVPAHTEYVWGDVSSRISRVLHSYQACSGLEKHDMC